MPDTTKLTTVLILTLLLSGCAIKRRWVASERAYDNWMTAQCVKQGHTPAECGDPNWKPCVTTTIMEGEKVCE